MMLSCIITITLALGVVLGLLALAFNAGMLMVVPLGVGLALALGVFLGRDQALAPRLGLVLHFGLVMDMHMCFSLRPSTRFSAHEIYNSSSTYLI